MQLSPFLSGLMLALAASPAFACSVSASLIPAQGTLTLSADDTTLASDNPGGASVLVTVTNNPLTDGAYTISITAPTLVTSPNGFSPTALETSYLAVPVGVQLPVTQGYTTSNTSFPNLRLTTAVAITLNNRITATGGFRPGSYSTRTTVTCS